MARRTGFTSYVGQPGLFSTHLQGTGDRFTAAEYMICLCCHGNRCIGEATMDIIKGNVTSIHMMELQVRAKRLH